MSVLKPARLFFLSLLITGCSLPTSENYDYPKVIELPPVCMSMPLASERTEAFGRLTLLEAIRIALQGNPSIGETLARIRQAEADIGEVDAEFLPVISTSTSYVYSNAPSVYFMKKIDERELAPNTNFNYPGIISNFETDVSCYGNVYKGGISILNRWKAEKGKNLKQIDFLAVKNALTATVIEAYYNCLAFKEAVSVAEESRTAIQKQLEIGQSRYEEGALMRSDVLFLEVRLSETEESLIKAANAVKLSLSSLATLLGGDADAEIDVIAEDEDWIPVPNDYESALALALSLRPELLAARKQVEIAAIDVDAARREFLPRVDAFGKAYWDDAHLEYNGKKTNWETGVSVSWSLFEGGRRCYAIEKAKEIFKEMLLQDRRTVLSIQLDIKQAYLNTDSAKARLDAASTAVEHASENLRIITAQYQEDEKGITDYLDAQLMQMQSRLRKVQAYFEVKKNRAAVARSTGLFAIDEENL